MPAFVYNSSHVRDLEDLRIDILELKQIKKDRRGPRHRDESEEEEKQPKLVIDKRSSDHSQF